MIIKELTLFLQVGFEDFSFLLIAHVTAMGSDMSNVPKMIQKLK